MTAFKRLAALMGAIAIASSEFAHNTIGFNLRREELVAEDKYKSRGKGGKFRGRRKVTSRVRRSNSKPHQGKQECARRLRSHCDLPKIPRRMWHVGADTKINQQDDKGLSSKQWWWGADSPTRRPLVKLAQQTKCYITLR